MTHRTFIAVDLDDAVRAELADVRERIEPFFTPDAPARWVDPDNLHVTVKFLGDVDSRELRDVCQAAQRVAGSLEPFQVELVGATDLPQRMRDRMLLAEVLEPSGRLAALAEACDGAMASLGFPREHRAFHPHVTLARPRARRGRMPRQAAQALAGLAFGGTTVDCLTVYTSELTADGPVYTPAATCPFRE
ncbi:MAG: RNA 2',3'-cyclic phosphodiesterase [Planctomycetes bacterium]|jgi:2'-5' RNA ligase|nr:RNA 2',3'-cyclic phosphodiesterase [Phycisphaerae bacterium]NBB94365.1 RNA 2',3'-cyclic phosphodiesterase [Planctomycetota bacterium]